MQTGLQLFFSRMRALTFKNINIDFIKGYQRIIERQRKSSIRFIKTQISDNCFGKNGWGWNLLSLVVFEKSSSKNGLLL